MLDASKAFDRVNLLALIKKLYAKGLSPSYLRFLNGLYKEQNMRVRWNSNFSELFFCTQWGKARGCFITHSLQSLLG